MRLSRRKFLSLCAKFGAFSLAGGTIGCTGQKEAKVESQLPERQFPQVKGTFIEGTSSGDAETLNWILAGDGASLGYVNFTMDGLITYDNNLNIVLRWLSEPIEVSEDGLRYTLRIRDDLYWSDGKQVTAEDFVYTYRNLMFADWMPFNYKDDYREEIDGEKRFVEIKAINKTSYQFIRQTVNPEFLYTITDFWVYPKHIVKKYEGDIEAFTQADELNNLSYTGNLGPYRFVEWIRNDKFVLERNPDYYLGKESGAPYFEKYVVKILGSAAARHAALEAGDITSASIDPLQVKKFKELKHINVYTQPTSGYNILVFNFRNNGWEGFKNKKIRQAIAMSISKDALIQSIYLGFADPAFSFIPRPSPWFVEDGLSRYGVDELYDKERAMQIFQDEGYELHDGKILDGEALRLTVVTNSGNKVRESICFLVKQELSDIGIDVEMKLLPWTTELNQYLRNKVPGSDEEPAFNNGPDAVSEKPWDMIVMGFSTDVLSPSGSSVFFTSDGGLNFGGFSNPDVDALFNRIRTKESLDEDKRREIYGKISILLSEDLPGNFLAYPVGNVGFQSNVMGIEPGISMGYNYHEWYFA
jgi:peptide/nickel transport system substrate-binding protein